MNRVVLVSLVGAGGVLCLMFMAFFFWPKPAAAPATTPFFNPKPVVTVDQTYVNTPVTRYAPPDHDPNKPQPTTKMLLQLASGKSIVVHDVVHDNTTVSDPSIPNRYFLTGGLDPVAQDYPYSIYYSSVDQSFTIVLYQEPFETTRAKAEQDLLAKLGVDQPTACGLRYQVVAPGWASAQYSGQNLGFSFCPGEVQFSQ